MKKVKDEIASMVLAFGKSMLSDRIYIPIDQVRGILGALQSLSDAMLGSLQLPVGFGTVRYSTMASSTVVNRGGDSSRKFMHKVELREFHAYSMQLVDYESDIR